jgi:hypothetical protein
LKFAKLQSGGCIAEVKEAAAFSQNKDWRCLADLVKVYDKTGRSTGAVQTASKLWISL